MDPETKRPTSTAGFFTGRALLALTLCCTGALLGLLSLAGRSAGEVGSGPTPSSPSLNLAAPAGPSPPPGGGLFIAVGSMTLPRSNYAATPLSSGKVLITGGEAKFLSISWDGPPIFEYTNRAELFDPATQTFATLSSMNSARSGHTATLLPDGRVLISGGYNGEYLNTAELFDPTNGTFTLVPSNMISTRDGHTATLLPNGKILIAGGYTGTVSTNTAEIFDPVFNTFTLLTPMVSPRTGHRATLLPSGKVLIATRQVGGVSTNTAELFDPALEIFVPLAPMTSPRSGQTATLLPSGEVLLAGGSNGPTTTPTNTAELFDPASMIFTSLPNTMTSARWAHTATLLASGKVLLAGGYTGSDDTNAAELFDPASQTFAPLSDMNSVRWVHTATLLPSGKVLVAGGRRGRATLPGFEPTNTAELFDPDSQTFTALPPMTSARFYHTATLLRSGKVLITGGGTTDVWNGSTNTAELFDPGLQLVSVVSRKIHGGAGTFDLDLPLTGNPGIECRSGGATGDYVLVFRFLNTLSDINPVSSVTASATTSSGTQSVTAGGHIGTDTHEYLVDLSGVPNASHLTVTLHGVTDSVGNVGDVSANMDVLYGDVNASGNVDAADVGQVQRQNNKPVTSSNFRMDVNVSGNIDAADVGQVQRQNSKHL